MVKKAGIFSSIYSNTRSCHSDLLRLRRRMYKALSLYGSISHQEQRRLLKEIISISGSLKISISHEISQTDRLISNEDKVLERYRLPPISKRVAVTNLGIAKRKMIKSESIIRRLSGQLGKALEKDVSLSKRMLQIKLLSHNVELEKNLQIGLLCLKDFAKRIELRIMLEKGPKIRKLNEDEIRKGDVILSYKTKDFLSKHILSKLVSIAERSQITHVSIAYPGRNSMHMIGATAINERVEEFEISHHKGEILIIMRPKLNKTQEKKLYQALDMLHEDLKNNKDEYKFAELKSWFAVFFGWIDGLIISFTRFNFLFPNPINTNSKFFCSDLIDRIFKYADIYLTPRSELNSMVGPSEFMFSPVLDMVGLIGDPEDLKEVDASSLSS